MNAIQYEKTPADNPGSALNPSSDQRQKLMLKEASDEPAQWNMSPAELYGCLCHKPEHDDSIAESPFLNTRATS